MSCKRCITIIFTAIFLTSSVQQEVLTSYAEKVEAFSKELVPDVSMILPTLSER